MDTTTTGSAPTPEALLLGRIEQELNHISERQHALARRMGVLRKARTLLHVGSSALEVNAMLAEHMKKESAQLRQSAPNRARYDAELYSMLESPSWGLGDPDELDRGELRISASRS